ncbi:MAG: hypothetical protein PHN80_08840 [Hespellia sp.]|nr:hypothetical protein [Hespellia sp.]
MSKQMNYEIIKLIERDGRCHISMDVVKGELLINWLRGSPTIEKKQLSLWFRQLAGQLEKYHRCKKNQCYRFLNVYSVVVTKEQIYLLDLEAEGNAFIAKYMQRQEIRNGFSHPRAQMRSTTKTSIDLYSFGRTLQYILAHAQVVPGITKKEEHQLLKIIQRSIELNSKKQYQNFKQIQNELSKFKLHTIPKNWKVLSLLTVLIVSGIVSALLFYGTGREKKSAVHLSKNTEQKENSQTAGKKNVEGGQMRVKNTDGVETDSMSSGGDALPQTDQTRINGAGTSLLPQSENEVEETGDIMEQLKADSLENTAEANKEMIQIGEKAHMEVLQYLAMAYDREEMNQQAIKVYGELCQMSLQRELLEQVYKRRAELQEKEGMNEAASATLKEAMENESLKNSSVLIIAYIRILCKTTEVDKANREEELNTVVDRIPAVKESEEYKKLVQEYGITEEGGKLCIGT